MQVDPLMVQLDWFFTSTSWTLKFPNTLVNPLARPTLDHVPCVVSIGTSIPKAKVFRFEDYWIRLTGFLDVVNTIWNINCPGDAAKCILGKLKLLCKGLKKWSASFQVLDGLIANCNYVIMILHDYEEQRILHISKWSFRNIVKKDFSICCCVSRSIGRKDVQLVGLNLEMRTHPFSTQWKQ
jgi:hypothetical protein